MKNTRFIRRAFTLVEFLTAMAIMSILLLAIASALSFSIKLSSGQGSIDQTNLLAAGDVADQISDDLQVASNFSERTTNSITLTVPDRTGAGAPDQIRYAWDGISGDSLTRQFLPASSPTLTAANATYPPITLLPGVTNFGLNYLTRQMGVTASTDSSLLTTSAIVLGANVAYNIDNNHWLSQSITVPLPAFTSTFSITRLLIYMKTGPVAGGVLKVRVTASVGGYPGTILEEEPLYQSALSSAYEYGEVDFKNLTGITAGTPLCIVVGYTTGTGIVAIVQYQSAASALLSGAVMSTSSNAGSAWSSPASTNLLRFSVYGTIP